MSEPIPVVFDVNVLVGAVAGGNTPFRSWPSPPPVTDNPFADCVGVMCDAAEFSLWVSPHILENLARVLTKAYRWEADKVDVLLAEIGGIAEDSGGGIVTPPALVSDCPDWEDNRILDVAAEVGALLIVSDDVDLTALSPWRGTPILRPREFAAKVDGIRRHHRRRGRRR